MHKRNAIQFVYLASSVSFFLCAWVWVIDERCWDCCKIYFFFIFIWINKCLHHFVLASCNLTAWPQSIGSCVEWIECRQFYFCSACRFQAAQTSHLRKNSAEPGDRRETVTPCGRVLSKRLDSNGLRVVGFCWGSFRYIYWWWRTATGRDASAKKRANRSEKWKVAIEAAAQTQRKCQILV